MHNGLLLDVWSQLKGAGFDCSLHESGPGQRGTQPAREVDQRLVGLGGCLELTVAEAPPWHLVAGQTADIPSGMPWSFRTVSAVPARWASGIRLGSSGSDAELDTPVSDAELAQFETEGYLVVEDAVPLSLIERWRTLAEGLCREMGEEEGVRPFHERALFRHGAFRETLSLPRLMGAAERLLGADLQLLALDLLFTRPGFRSTFWHSDVSFHCNKTLSMNCGLYLQDLNETVGRLGVVPGSHRRGRGPGADDVDEDPAGALWLSPRAGSAVFFDACLWHCGGPNLSAHPRVGLFAYFGRYFIKRMDAHFTQPLSAELMQSTDARVRQLLGFALRPGVASYHGDDPGYNLRGQRGIDFA